MNRFFIPTKGTDDWKRLLADPTKHWRKDFSAFELAKRWETSDGFPSEIAQIFAKSGIPAFQKVEFLIGFPEYQVHLPGGSRPSQNDLFILAKGQNGQLISICVEGKAAEPFGPTISEWIEGASEGKRKRLTYLTQQLGLTREIPPHIRYQLLHRTVSAIIEANRFNAVIAIMIVHSFSADNLWFEDYQDFLALFGVQGGKNKINFINRTQEVDLYCGWASGNVKTR